MRIVIISDLHCGSEAGMTPLAGNKTQAQLYNRYADCIQHFGGRPDLLVVNGDAVDGLQLKGRGRGDSDWASKQIMDAATLISMWKARRVAIVAGTPYHTRAATSVDFDEILAHQLKAEYYRKLNLTACGWFRLQCRHKINSSSIPHGRFTAPARSKAWGVLNAAQSGGRAPHLCVFSHVHYWTYAEDAFGATMTTPAWQAIGSMYGDTACDGHVDVGAVQLVVGKSEKDGWTWQKRLYPAAAADRSVSL
jgi:hypothetical protein